MQARLGDRVKKPAGHAQASESLARFDNSSPYVISVVWLALSDDRASNDEKLEDEAQKLIGEAQSQLLIHCCIRMLFKLAVVQDSNTSMVKGSITWRCQTTRLCTRTQAYSRRTYISEQHPRLAHLL